MLNEVYMQGVWSPDPMEIIDYIKLRKVSEPIILPTFYSKYKIAVILKFYGGTVPGTLALVVQ
jgi:hypothetical protein